MIGIICAMEAEIEALRAHMRVEREETVSGIGFLSGSLEGEPVVLARCGVGKVFAALCAQTMVLRYGVTALVNSGVAGTLTGELHIGDVILSKECVQHDMDTTAVGDDYGLVSGINRVRFPAGEKLVEGLSEALRARGVRFRTGTIATGDQFVASQARRDWIVSTFGAEAVEMEAGAIAQAAFVNGVPYVVIRVISDEADGRATVDYPVFMREAAKTSSEVVLAWLAHRSGKAV